MQASNAVNPIELLPRDSPNSGAPGETKETRKTTLCAGRVSHFAMLVAVGVSLSVLAGLAADAPALTSWAPGAPAMVLQTAVGTFLAGIGLWLAQRKQRTPTRFIAGFLSLLGCLNLFVQSSAVATHYLAFLAVPSMQMAPGMAIVFILFGAGLTLLNRVKISFRVHWLVASLGVGVSSVGLLTLLGYVSGLPLTPWWDAFFLQMAIPTAVCDCALGTALVASLFHRVEDGSEHISIAAAVLAILGLLLLFAGVDAAVLASSDAVLTTRVENRKTSSQIRAVQSLVGNTRKLETALRGYLLTGEQRYLASFDLGRQRIDQILRDGTVQDAQLLEATKLKFDELNRTVTLEKQGRHEEAVGHLKSSDGLRYMDEIEARANVLSAPLRKTNSHRQSASQQSILSVRTTVLLSYGIAVLFAGGALLLVGREMRRRSFIERTLRESEARIISELRAETARAEDASRAKSSFLASMSHEIRTPMNAILGMADMLWESELSEAQRHYVEVFRRAGGNLLVLINDILDLSKIESGNFSLEKINFDLQEVVDQVIEILQPRAESKALVLTSQVGPGTTTHVVGDPARLQQILLNLLNNAVKFTDKGEVSLRIRSRDTAETHTNLEFEVSDTGIGISKDKLSSIFEDFTQAESSTTRRFGGTGLGLSISRRLAKHMGGELQVRSEEGKGSIFLFDVVLPIGIEQAAAAPLTLDEIAGKRVLIVDNNATNRVVLSEMCSGLGMVVTCCRSGAEAVESTELSLQGQPFALALVDRMMPGMDGFETAHRMRILDPKMPVLMVSSDSQAGDISRCRELGFCGHLIRPVRRTELLQLIVKALSRGPKPAPSACAGEPSEPSRGQAKHMQLLVAEDSQDNRSLLQAYCKGTTFALTFAEDGEQAVAAYQSGTFDLVLMDIQMPVMDGLTATGQIRAIETAGCRKRTPVVALTANVLQQDVARATEAGCDAHLAKPISKKNLLSELERWRATMGSSVSSLSIAIPEGLEELAHGYLSSRQRELPVLERLLERSDGALGRTELRPVKYRRA